MVHTTVLLHTTIELLNLKPGNTVLDCTVNGGGHSSEVCRRFGQDVQIIGMDLDESALEQADKRLRKEKCNFQLFSANFRNLDSVLKKAGVETVAGVIFDLGLSSPHLENSGRGFSFQRDEPLSMTFSKKADSSALTAEKIVNEWDAENIQAILEGYGEERFAGPIARAIVRGRQEKRIETTFELLQILNSALPEWYKRSRRHFATRTFQALRMTVNDEIAALKEGLDKAFSFLSVGGRIVVISFHSVEDRAVKKFFKSKAQAGQAEIILKKPTVPSREEIKDNPRARSGKLRVAEKRKIL